MRVAVQRSKIDHIAQYTENLPRVAGIGLRGRRTSFSATVRHTNIVRGAQAAHQYRLNDAVLTPLLLLPAGDIEDVVDRTTNATANERRELTHARLAVEGRLTTSKRAAV